MTGLWWAKYVGEFVGQFFTTIALTKTGTVKLAGPAPVDLSKVVSEMKLQDPELLKLISSPLKPGKPKKKRAQEAQAQGNSEE